MHTLNPFDFAAFRALVIIATGAMAAADEFDSAFANDERENGLSNVQVRERTDEEISNLVNEMLTEPDRYDRGVARQRLLRLGEVDPDPVLNALPQQRDNSEIAAYLRTLRNEIAWQHLHHQATVIANGDAEILESTEPLFSDYVRNVFFYIQPAEVFRDPYDDIPQQSVSWIMAGCAHQATPESRVKVRDIFALFLKVSHPRLREEAVHALGLLGRDDVAMVTRRIAGHLDDEALGVREIAAREICILHKLHSDEESVTFNAGDEILMELATEWWNGHRNDPEYQ